MQDPLGRPIPSYFTVLGDEETAVVEMAAASGIALLNPEEFDPLRTTTFGTGELVRAALDAGLRRIIIAIGESATNDGGMGVAAALGARFVDNTGRELEPRGGALGFVHSVDLSGLDPRIRDCDVKIACDVTNTLLGEEGATRVFGPQKGATSRMVDLMERGMSSYARQVEETVGRELASAPGAGAAGGLGFGLMAFLGSRVEPGIEVVMRAVGFEEKACDCDLIITGAGKYDVRTPYGKTITGVISVARKLDKPLAVLVGTIISEDSLSTGVGAWGKTGVFCVIPRPMPLEEALATARANFISTAAQLGGLIASLNPVEPATL